ncbi:MAG: 23S rRNA pseudouridine(1911/1915/1917) synthase RluD [Pseudomonadales bacterium]|jgi:23S rRNA pseudouridine1911/1915/1917 synthase
MSEVTRQSTVPSDLAGERVDKIAAVLFDEFSRAALQGWIQAGALTVDGEQVKPKIRLLGGETLRLNARLEAKEDWQTAEPVPFEVIYEDADLLVINKPAGVVVHPGAGNPRGTLVNGLLNHRRSLELVPRAGIVHRLDKDTSGLLLIAAHLGAHKRLVDALQERRIARKYAALVEGVMVGGQDIDRPIGRDPVRRTLQRVREDGREALTRVRVVQRYRSHTLITAALETGRTHQIRVHLSSIGHPLVGDSRYRARGRLPAGASSQTIQLLQSFKRQALHAERLDFEHPGSGAPMSFQTPPPTDMQTLIEALGADAGR